MSSRDPLAAAEAARSGGPSRPGAPWLWLALAVVLPILAVAGLFPFAFSARNEVAWSSPGPGLDFRARSIAFSEEPLILAAGDAFTVEMWVEPEELPTRRIGAMAALFDGMRPAPLLVAQWKTNLVVRLRNPADREGRAHREIGYRDVLTPGHLHHVVVASSEAGTRAFVDGQEAPSHIAGGIVPEDDALEVELVVGNSPAATEPWNGRIEALALFDRALSESELREHDGAFTQGGAPSLAELPGAVLVYAFREGQGERAASLTGGPEVVIEPTLRPLEKIVLSPASHAFVGQGRDLLLNILGFVPLGWLVMLLAARRISLGRALLVATLAGGLASLSIEIAQVWLPGRVSSLVDLLCNTAGAALGAVLALPWLRGLSARADVAHGDSHAQ